MSARLWKVWQNPQGLLGVFDANAHLFKDFDAVVRQIEAAPIMLAALDAHAAWGLAEEAGSKFTWEARSELCNYAEWLTKKARSLAAGKPFDELYNGVPHLIVWPGCEIQREDEEGAAELVLLVLSSLEVAP